MKNAHYNYKLVVSQVKKVMMLAVRHTQPCANFIQRNLLERAIRSSKYPDEEYDTTRLKRLRENGAQCDKVIQNLSSLLFLSFQYCWHSWKRLHEGSQCK